MKLGIMRRLLCCLLAIGALAVLVGCGGNSESQTAGEPDSASPEIASESASQDHRPTSEDVTAIEPELGVAPFEFTGRLPEDLDPPSGDWYCVWNSGDGTQHIGSTLSHEYETAGDYEMTWTIMQGDQPSLSGSIPIRALQLIDARCDTSSRPSVDDVSKTVGRPVGDEILARSVCLPYSGDCYLVDRESAFVYAKVPIESGLSPRPFQESGRYIFSYYGDEIFVLSQATGQEVFRADFGEITSRRVSVADLAYSRSRDVLFVVVYPNTEEEVTGNLFTVSIDDWEINQLPASSPVRPYTAGFDAAYNEATDQLILVTRGVYAPNRIYMLSGEDGKTVYEGGLRANAFTGIYVDNERNAIWMADGDTILRVQLDEAGIPVSSIAGGLKSRAFTVDSATGNLYCIVDNGYSSNPAQIAVIDPEMNLVLSADVEKVDRASVHSVRSEGLLILDRPDGRSLMIVANDVYVLSLNSLQLKSKTHTIHQTWTIGESGNGDLIVLDPTSSDVYLLPEGQDQLSLHAEAPESLTSSGSQLIDALWDDRSASIYMLFLDAVAKWNLDEGSVKWVSTADYITDTYQSTINRVRLVGPSLTGSLLIRLPGDRTSENPVYHVDWEAERVVAIENEVPSGSTVCVSKGLAELVWVENGNIVIGDGANQIRLPQNVDWAESNSLAVPRTKNAAVVLSSRPSGLVAVVNLETREVTGVMYIGSTRYEPIIEWQEDSMWIAWEGGLYQLHTGGEFAERRQCLSIPYSILGSAGEFPTPGQLHVSSDGDMCYLVSQETGTILCVPSRAESARSSSP